MCELERYANNNIMLFLDILNFILHKIYAWSIFYRLKLKISLFLNTLLSIKQTKNSAIILWHDKYLEAVSFKKKNSIKEHVLILGVQTDLVLIYRVFDSKNQTQNQATKIQHEIIIVQTQPKNMYYCISWKFLYTCTETL